MVLNRVKKPIILFGGIFILLMFAQSFNKPFGVIEHAKYLGEFHSSLDVLTYLSSYFLATLTIVILLGLRSRLLFILFLILFFLFYSMDFFMQFLGSKNGFTYNDFALSINELGNYSNLLTYIDYIGYALLLSAIFMLILYFIRVKFVETTRNSLYATIFVVAIVGTFILTRIVHSPNYKVYPAFVKMPLFALKYLKTPLVIKDREFSSSIEVANKPKFKNIIWIIDESITGTYLSINGYEKETTPYLEKLNETDKMVNFGVVNSISNCSAESNLFLRIGLNPQTFTTPKENIFTIPTIFQYAKRAGFSTWLMDSQAGKGSLQDYLTPYDLEDLDAFVTLPDETLAIDRDLIGIDKIQKALESDKPHFMVLVKWGAHWPYLLDYDIEKASFKPMLESALGGMTLDKKEKLTNTYLNAIKFAADDYMETFLNKIDLENTIIFYTSDHGQNILEVQGDVRTHCHSVNQVVKNEISVPLFVFQEHAKTLFTKKEDANYAQIQIFPTTLSMMGYGDDIVKQYGNTLEEGLQKSETRKTIIRLEGTVIPYR